MLRMLQPALTIASTRQARYDDEMDGMDVRVCGKCSYCLGTKAKGGRAETGRRLAWKRDSVVVAVAVSNQSGICPLMDDEGVEDGGWRVSEGLPS